MEYIKLNFEKKDVEIQYHVHEFQGYLKTTEDHYHRCTGITGEAIPIDKKDHIHEIVFRSDFVNGHYHEYIGRSSGAIEIGDRHIHYIDSFTNVTSGHQHGFRLITLLHDPSGE
ncbi:YmaF family protein [Anaerocolumna sedimenticola]|uniref:YmaF family protein n=1 Tax=Anaerocolumna sedimenticola TaxID=2696063 RepID=UPI001FE3B2A5|nr:YmaF family protein [Anaerocolumna sedimenticola]